MDNCYKDNDEDSLDIKSRIEEWNAKYETIRT